MLWALGHSLNTTTLGGMALAVGILVDDATVEMAAQLGLTQQSVANSVLVSLSSTSQVLAGLSAGERVLVHPGDDLPEGTTVEPAP